jgi:RNA polymerase sigma-70 factor (ECF subfamily)
MAEVAHQKGLSLVAGSKDTGRRELLRDLYQRYGGSVYGRCLYLLKDKSRAEDAAQDVFAKALTHLDSFEGAASPLTWLMKIATHHCLNALRSERAGWRLGFSAHAELAAVPTDGAREQEVRDWVRKLLSRFDPETQAAAVHYHVDGMTLEEVAEVLERSVPTIRKRLENFSRVAGLELTR